MPPMPALQSLEHLLLSENPLQEVRKGRICPKRERQVWRGSLKVSKWCNRDLQHCYRDVCFRAEARLPLRPKLGALLPFTTRTMLVPRPRFRMRVS